MTHPNTTLITALANSGQSHEPDFLLFTKMCLPASLLILSASFAVCYFEYGRNLKLHVPLDVVSEQRKAMGRMTRDEKVAGGALLLMVALWLSRRDTIGGSGRGWSEVTEGSPWRGEATIWSDGGVAIMCGFLLFLIPSSERSGEAILTEAVVHHLPWWE